MEDAHAEERVAAHVRSLAEGEDLEVVAVAIGVDGEPGEEGAVVALDEAVRALVAARPQLVEFELGNARLLRAPDERGGGVDRLGIEEPALDRLLAGEFVLGVPAVRIALRLLTEDAQRGAVRLGEGGLHPRADPLVPPVRMYGDDALVSGGPGAVHATVAARLVGDRADQLRTAPGGRGSHLESIPRSGVAGVESLVLDEAQDLVPVFRGGQSYLWGRDLAHLIPLDRRSPWGTPNFRTRRVPLVQSSASAEFR